MFAGQGVSAGSLRLRVSLKSCTHRSSVMITLQRLLVESGESLCGRVLERTHILFC